MVISVVLAGGTGERMKTSGLPKQFLLLNGKPLIFYTLVKFENCNEVDDIIIPCNPNWIEKMKEIVKEYNFKKVKAIINGGKNRQESIIKAIDAIKDNYNNDDIVMIHDGVRPLVSDETLIKNIVTAKQHGNAMTVRQNIETVVITKSTEATYDDFKKRDNVYTLTSPQTFKKEILERIYNQYDENNNIPDASLLLAYLGDRVQLVKEDSLNIKITKPEDFFYLKSYLEYKENTEIFGI